MAGDLQCWRCGAALADLPQPLARLAQCPGCGADLHVCRMCRFYNPRYSDRCDEPAAEPPRDPGRANFCDWFKPAPGAWRGGSDPAAARARLAALFGEAPAEPAESGESADAAGPPGPREEARRRLEALFRKDDEKGND